MKIAVESVEVATLKADGRAWDGPGGARVPADQLASFFALDLDGQLGRLVREGSAPVPPDLVVQIYSGDRLLLETDEQKGFDAEWMDGEAAEVEPGDPLRIEVWDRDVIFHDLIGRTDLGAPASGGNGRWVLGGFGQVRRLVLRLGTRES